MQTADGQITVSLTSHGIAKDPRITQNSLIVFYLYKKKDYSINCSSAADRIKCEDQLVFKNEKIDALGFTNEPGYFGYNPDRGSYFPELSAPQGQTYPATKPNDPDGFPDPDAWQCIRNPFSSSPNQGKFECGINAHPIRNFNKDLTTHTMAVYAATYRGLPAPYGAEYNLFMSSYHPVKDGDRYYGYFAVHYSAIRPAADAEDRFDLGSAAFKRPIEPDLVSPRIDITINLQAAGKNPAGSTYEIPDYTSWYDPFSACRSTQDVPGNSVYFSEILWMGSKDLSGTSSSEDEFIEIYNSNSFDVVVSGWRLNGVGSGSGAISLPNCALIRAGAVFTVGKPTSKSIRKLDYADTGMSLSNSGEATLGIQDAAGNTISSMTGCTAPPWGGQGILGSTGNANRSMRLTNLLSPSGNCFAGWSTTSSADPGYLNSSQNLAAAFKTDSDSGVDGTIATPGFKGP